MGKSAGKAPAAPNPLAVSQAQTQSNIETARKQSELNNVNQVTPYGSLTYSQDPNNPDRWTATQSLSAAEQGMLDRTNEGKALFADAALSQLRGAQNMLSRPVDLSNEAVEGRLAELGRARLDPLMAQRRASLQTSLTNQGITPGSEAWTTAMRQQGQDENDAYNQLFLTGRQQAIQELLTQRNQPLNELAAIVNGSMVQNPQFANTQGATVAPTDVNGAFGLSQQAQQNAYNARAQQAASTNQGVATAAGAALTIAAIA